VSFAGVPASCRSLITVSSLASFSSPSGTVASDTRPRPAAPRADALRATAADDHQSKNAAEFQQAGAAVVVDQAQASAATLADLLETLLRDSARREAIARATRSLARPTAAADVVERLSALARR
jgi:hypothetical protein